MAKHLLAAIGIGGAVFAAVQIALHATLDPESAPSIFLAAVGGVTSVWAGLAYWDWAYDRKERRGR